jgi:hypothetical protein
MVAEGAQKGKLENYSRKPRGLTENMNSDNLK